ncbi:MAG: type II toxin-antitoxin system VapC family toxin [Nitrososphaerota archaeon]|nr:type II toxin-antitoxin system VapC family toxin [Nitrososphaerota archaeon]
MIDSWTWIEYWKGGKFADEAASYIDGEEELVVSTINLAEVYLWVAKSYDDATAEEKVATMEKRCHVIPVERDVALEAAKIKRKEKLGLADSLILATARQVGGRVVTGDSDMRNLRDVVFLATRA